jgi:TfoX/Sxy family transcriptional regulator of competence genes
MVAIGKLTQQKMFGALGFYQGRKFFAIAKSATHKPKKKSYSLNE